MAVNTDPRFKRQKRKASKVKIDDRFKDMFEEEQFVERGVKVDKYGRKRGRRAEEVERLREYYDLDEEDEGLDKDEKMAVSSASASASESELESEPSSDSEKDYLMDQVMAQHPLVNTTVELGDATRRLALVNMDWDNVKAVDILTFCSAFKPPGGTILSVSVYPSEFGKERIERERSSGPALESVELDGDSSKDYDEMKLRKYQLERLKYYYAVIECDRVETAVSIYANCDGREFEQSGNVIDLRYIPDSVDFTSSTPTDRADHKEGKYRPKTDLTTAALQTSSVKLTWDQDDPERAKLTRQAVQSGMLSKRERQKMDVRDVDLAAYLASGSESEEIDREEYRQRLLRDGKDNGVFGRKSQEGDDLRVVFSSAFKNTDDTGDIDAEYTFTPDDQRTTPDSDHDSADDLTVFQRNQLKLKQKQAAKRAQRRASRKHNSDDKSASAAELTALMRHSQCATADDDDEERETVVDTKDERFKAIYDQPEFAIDPSAPGFKRTKGMQALLEERAKRRQ